MLTLFLSFIKNKLFSSAGVFLLIFSIIFAVFLFSNSDTVLSKFGFETTTTLKGQLVKAQADLVTLKTANDRLSDTIKELNDAHVRDIKAVVELQTNKDITKKVVDVIITKKKKVESNVEKFIESNSTYTLTSVTLPLKEINQLSTSNIDSLNETYHTLFESIPGKKEVISDINVELIDSNFQPSETMSC